MSILENVRLSEVSQWLNNIKNAQLSEFQTVEENSISWVHNLVKWRINRVYGSILCAMKIGKLKKDAVTIWSVWVISLILVDTHGSFL